MAGQKARRTGGATTARRLAALVVVASTMLTLAGPAGAAPRTLKISDATVVESTGSAKTMRFTVSLSSAAAVRTTVKLKTSNGTALAPGDYVAKSTTVTFRPGQRTKRVAVTIKGDALDEPKEVFRAKLSKAVGARIADGSGKGTIVDDDPPPSIDPPAPPAPPALSILDASVVEGSSSTPAVVGFNIKLSSPSPDPVTVRYSTTDGFSNAAQAGPDYTATSQSIAFAPGETTRTVAVTVTADSLDEYDETFYVSLTEAAGAPVLRPVATGTIVDDDAPPKIYILGRAFNEGNAGSGRDESFMIQISRSSGKVVSVDFATTGGTAESGSDYTPVATRRMYIDPGDFFEYAPVHVNRDALHEAHETITASISNPANATLASNEVLGSHYLTGPATTGQQIEALTPSPSGETWYTYGNTVARQNAANSFGTTAHYNFAPEETPRAITAGPDGNVWFTETGTDSIGKIDPSGVRGSASLTFWGDGGAPQGIVAGRDGNLWVTRIQDPDAPTAPTLLRLQPTGGMQQHGFTASPDGARRPRDITVGGDGNVWYATEGISPQLVRVVTPQGAQQAFPVPQPMNVYGLTIGDLVGGPDGNVWFTTSGGNHVICGCPIGNVRQIGRMTPTGVVTYFPLPAELGTPDAITLGADGNLWFTLKNPNRIGRITPTGSITDYALPAGTTEVSDIAAGTDGFIWWGAYERIGALHLARSSATMQIGNDDAAPTISINDPVIDEPEWGGDLDVSFTVTLSAPSEETVTVDFSTSQGSAVDGEDYEGEFGRLTFAPGETVSGVDVQVYGDDDPSDGDETFTLNLASPAHARITDFSGTATIVELQE